MAFPQGIYFRNSDDQTDPTNYDMSNIGGASVFYSQTSAQGNSVGVEFNGAFPSFVNRTGPTDVRLKGVMYFAKATTQDYRIDLPSTGDYRIDCALGDVGFSHPVKLEMFDNTTSLGVIYDSAGTDVASNHWVDGSGTVRTSEADWVANHTPSGTLTFASTICRFRIGGTTGTDANTVIAALYIEAVTAAGNPLAGSLAMTGVGF